MAEPSEMDEVQSLSKNFERERENVSSEHESSINMELINKTESVQPHDHPEEEDRDIYQVFSYFDAGVGLLSIVIFFADVVTDIQLANDYFHKGNMFAFIFTTVFISLPAVITFILNVRWYMLDYRMSRDDKSPLSLWLTRFTFTILLMGSVIRQLEYLYHGFKSRSKGLSKEEKERRHKMMRMENGDICCLRMFESFLETAPQLVLQIYMYVVMGKHMEGKITAGILTSWVGLSWSMVAYKKALRLSDKERLTCEGIILTFLWRACEMGPRVVVFGLFASQFGYLVFIVIGVHWIAMSLWLICQNTQFHENRCEERIFNFICGFVLIFCFLDVRGGVTRYKMLVYYFIFHVENWTMSGFWLYFTDTKGQWFYMAVFVVIPLGLILQIFFQLMNYGCFHPLGRRKIPCCLERGKYSCYEYLCHELETDEAN